MATQRLNVTGDLTTPTFDWYYSGSTRWQSIATSATYGDSVYLWSNYIEADSPGATSAFQMSSLVNASQLTQVVLNAYIYCEYQDDITFELYAGATKIGDYKPPSTYEGWVQGTIFSGTHSSNLTDIRLRVVKSDPNEWWYYGDVSNVYATATFTQTPATALTLSGPSTALTNVGSLFTVETNGSLAGTVVVTPAGTGITFSPTTVTLNSGTLSGTFTATASSSGSKSISITNDGGLTNPSAHSLTVSDDPNGDYYSAVSALTPWVHYRTNESSGTSFADYSGNSRTGTLTGTVTYGQLGPGTLYGVKYSSTAGIQIPAFSWTQSEYTMLVWVKHSSLNAMNIFSRSTANVWESGSKTLYMLNTSGQINYNMYGSSDSPTSTYNLTVGTWHLIALTKNSSNVHTIWVNGVARGNSTFSPSADSGTHVSWLGRAGGGSGTSGEADVYYSNPAFFTYALTGVQMQSLIDATLTVPGLNMSFETPSYPGSHAGGPTGGTWTFNGRTGITGGGGFVFSTSPPNGSQAAFVQDYNFEAADFSQTFSALTIGATYTVTVAMQQRTHYGNGSARIECLWDDVRYGSVVIPDATWTDYTFGGFTATSTSHTLKFKATDKDGSDRTSYLDNVRITFTEPSGSTPSPALFFFSS